MRTIFTIFIAGFLLFNSSSCDTTHAEKNKETKQKKDKKKKNGKKENESASEGIILENKWEMPGILQEISGFAFLGANRFACVQDEAGAVFIYNANQNKIEKQISFGSAGDYEGLAVAGKTAYVVRSDGQLFQITNFESPGNPQIKSFTTGLTAENNVEGITYDEKNNRLLLAIKGSETGKKDYKGIYAFNLATLKLVKEPVIKIDLNHSVFNSRKSKNQNNAIQPSDVAVNPANGDIYVLEGTNPQLLIMDNQGNIKNRFVLDKQDFSQPEGITFGTAGELFIANEGKKTPGNILKVKLPTEEN